MTTPIVSVVMPAYNGAQLIGETIESVLAQSFTDFELIIVDDCSTDTTWDVIHSFSDPRIRCFRAAENGGPVTARNIGFAQVRGRYIAGLDQDDLCAPDRFAQQVAFLDAHAHVALVASACTLLRDGCELPWQGTGSLTSQAIDWLLMMRNPLVWSSVMFRTDAARQLTPFERPEMLFAEDFDLYHRIRAHGDIARLDAPLLVYRCHPDGVSKKFHEKMSVSAAAVLTEYYAAIFGPHARENALLVERHLMAETLVPDLSTLTRILQIMAALHQYFIDQNNPDADTQKAIQREYIRLWWGLLCPALRHRTVVLRDVLPLRPDCVPLSLRQPQWLVSPVIGWVRALLKMPTYAIGPLKRLRQSF